MISMNSVGDELIKDIKSFDSNTDIDAKDVNYNNVSQRKIGF